MSTVHWRKDTNSGKVKHWDRKLKAGSHWVILLEATGLAAERPSVIAGRSSR
jgi:hypothetical protein